MRLQNSMRPVRRNGAAKPPSQSLKNPKKIYNREKIIIATFGQPEQHQTLLRRP